MQQLAQFDGLYGERTAPPGQEYLHLEQLEDRSPLFDWVISPHVHAALFQVFFIEAGAVTFAEAARKRYLTGPLVLLVPPAALHGFTYTPGAAGRILTLSANLVASLFPASSPLAPMLGTVQCLSDFAEPYPAAAVSELFAQLDEELCRMQPEKHLMLHLLVQRLLLVCYRLWRQAAAPTPGSNSANIRYFQQFQQRLRQTTTLPTVAQLAGELAITPTHLTRVCQAVAGKSASQLVQQYLLEEACQHLTYTTYSVAEIAYRLHFESPNYFAKFFRKHLGCSPSAFRTTRA